MTSENRVRNQRGAIAAFVAIVMVVIFGGAAFAVDISRLVSAKQELKNAVDAAAHAGAGLLPDDPTGAVAMAKKIAKVNDPQANPDVDMFCVVASAGSSRQVLRGQIPRTCDPGPGWESRAVCNDKICSIPCVPGPSTKCNTLRTQAAKDVPFFFAPVIGINNGTTGLVLSVACHGSCGQIEPNAMDVFVVADRTLSMSERDLGIMKKGIRSMLTTMNPQLQYVALGTIHSGNYYNTCEPSRSLYNGSWMAADFSNDYLEGQPGSRKINPRSNLVQVLDCLKRPDGRSATHGTHLAAAFKAAHRALGLGWSDHLPARSGNVQKVIIFETDGMPDETMRSTPATASDPAGGPQYARAIDNGYRYPIITPWSDPRVRKAQRGSGGVEGCKRLAEVAKIAKDEGILVITIGYGGAATGGCNISRLNSDGTFETDGPRVTDYLAEAASPATSGKPSKADHDCSTQAGATAENTDGDYFFCAAKADQLSSIFETAINQVSKGVRLIELPR